MSSGHGAVPWKVERARGGDEFWFARGCISVGPAIIGGVDEEAMAHARLVAMAPVVPLLLAACEQYANDPCTCGPDPGAASCCACYTRAALTSARGEAGATGGR